MFVFRSCEGEIDGFCVGSWILGLGAGVCLMSDRTRKEGWRVIIRIAAERC